MNSTSGRVAMAVPCCRFFFFLLLLFLLLYHKNFIKQKSEKKSSVCIGIVLIIIVNYQKRKLGPGSYDIKDFIQVANEKPRSGRGICDKLAPRFEKGLQVNYCSSCYLLWQYYVNIAICQFLVMLISHRHLECLFHLKRYGILLTVLCSQPSASKSLSSALVVTRAPRSPNLMNNATQNN